MKKRSAISNQQSARWAGENLRGAFTLMELLVAVAILVAIMAMVGVIFNAAGKASSIAQASNAVHRQLRTAATQIRLDLQSCQPGSGADSHAILAIASVEVAALATPKELEGSAGPKDPAAAPSGDPDPRSDIHRADVLMFTTDRDIQTYVYRPDPANPIELDRTAMVVYGHADLAELDPGTNPGSYTFSNPPRNLRRVDNPSRPLGSGSLNQSDMVAASLHLARRMLRFPARTLTPLQLANLPAGVGPSAANRTLTDPAILQGEFDVYYDPFDDPTDPNSILPLVGRGYYHYDASGPRYLAYNSRSILGAWWYRWDQGQCFLFDRDFWYRPGGTIACASGVPWTRDVGGAARDTCAPSQTTVPRVIGSASTTFDLGSFDVRDVFYDPSRPDRRSIIDPNPPAGAGDRMGAHFLPNCSDFHVEYTYDDPAELFLASDASGNWRVEPQAPIRWQSVPNGHQMIWSRLSVNPKNYSDPSDPRNRTDPIRWPRALRITMRSYGPGTALEQPVEQVIVHTFQ